METLSAIEVNEIRNVQLRRRVKKHTLMQEKSKFNINKRKSENIKDEKFTGKIEYQFHDVTQTFSSSRCNSVHVDLVIYVDHK